MREETPGSGLSLIEGESWTRWLHDLRRAEFEKAIDSVSLARDSTVLELGSGDGFQLNLLSDRFERVFAIDPGRAPERARGFAFADAEALPFPDATFDLVLSCCVVEHLLDRVSAMKEVARVLRHGGHAVHILPGRFWKMTSLVLNPFGYPLRVFEKWRAMRRVGFGRESARREGGDPAKSPGVSTLLGRWIWPPVHGTYRSHWDELRSFGRARWGKVVARPGLVVVAEAPTLAYTSFGFLRFRLPRLRVWMARHGLSSSHVFVLKKE